jgi:hypothetical protein
MEHIMRIQMPRVTVSGNQVVLRTEIMRDGKPFCCQFHYPVEYCQYICNERSDAFLISILPYAMQHSFHIQCEAPVSERLLYQIRNYYIPVLAKAQKNFHSITIEAQADNQILNIGKAVGTGLSCGVDSFYSVLKHINHPQTDYRLTHLVSMNVGSFGAQGGEFSQKWFREELTKARKVAHQMQLPLIEINSNLMEFYQQNHASSGTFRMAGAILGLQKLFSVYYISSGFSLNGFDITSEDNDDYDLFNLMVASNESTHFYSSGIEATRFERTRFVSDFEVTYNNLTVCLSGDKNCGKCEKCLRTIGALYVLGRLERYRNVFDIGYFYRHRHYMLVKMRCYGIGYMKEMYKEIFQALKQRNTMYYCLITLQAYIFQFPYEKTIVGAKKFLKKVLPDRYLVALKKRVKR